MFRQLYRFALNGNGTSSEGHHLEEAPVAPCKPASQSCLPPRFDSFEEIYRTAAVSPPQSAYSSLKVAEMINSPHLAGMSTESRRCSVLMALDAAGVDVKAILEDAMLRQRAVDDYEEAQQKKLQEFESDKAKSNRKIQADLDRITAEYMGQIQSNVDDVARHQDVFRIWQKSKQVELNILAGASAHCSQPGDETNAASLSVVIEHAPRNGRS
jgi:hypothetical protein